MATKKKVPGEVLVPGKDIEILVEGAPQPGVNEKYTRVKQGAKGDDVTKLKQLLAANGYSGFNLNSNKMGSKAINALTEYQKKAGINATGIADDDTWAALIKKFDKTTASGNAYNTYEGTTGNQADLAAIEGGRPAAYQSSYQDQISGLLDSILNREQFSYDMNADPLYQQYKDQYVSGGRNAMMDTMGNAAALTGGFGNSYASTAGNMAYQNYLQGLNDKSLDLYDRAYGRYQDQGNDMRSNIGLLMQQDNTDYGRYRDTYGDWQTDRDYAYGKTQDDQDQARWQAEYDLAARKAKKGGGGGGRSGGGRSGGSGSSGGGGGASGASDADLRKVAQNIYNGSGSQSDPYSAIKNLSSYSSSDKAKIKSYFDDLTKR